MMRVSAGDRNKQPILEVLQKHIDINTEYRFLEISSGSGLHLSYFSKHFPKVRFQPSEHETGLFECINEYRKDCENIYHPIYIDISQDIDLWDCKYEKRPLKNCRNSFDFMLNINMMHIAPFECAIGLFKNSSELLKPGGLLFTYGPYSINNILTPDSNVVFDDNLRRKNPAWGVRDIVDLKKLAEKSSIELSMMYDLPANNKVLVWKKI